MSRVRVLVIDDSAYSRRTIVKLLEEISVVEVIGYAVNGEEGLKKAMDLRPDLITLDLEMPGMDGFTLLRIIMTACPAPVIVVSSHSDDDRVFKALELGAVDFVAKPRRALSDQLLEIRDELQQKVGSLLNLNLQGLKNRTRPVPQVENLPIRKVARLPRGVCQKFEVLAIGASTGGPPALQKILSQMPGKLPFTILISQHMPSGFTRTFAERLNRMLPFEVKEASDGDILSPNQVLVAPGGMNMITVQVRDQVVIRLKSPSKDEKYIPSVNAMLASVARVYGARALSVVLTGMGNDGSLGVRKIKEAGGVVLAESEESAVVFGMPREAIATGVVDKIVNLDQMAEKILELCGFR
ncbi:MAG: chemotaxis response regulator protein-glutamate methylesterase [Geobacteraceae bacterium]|nr:chemotaxis response regulator protein-glutamate methylesterase [Geobacteraceae bacterium]